MTKHRRGSAVLRKLGLGILASILAFTLGCSADDIMGPGDVSVPEIGPGSGVEILAEPNAKDIDPVQGVSFSGHGSALIQADVGGVVSWGRFSVDIPAGALSEDTEISISRPNSQLVMCELEPHGIQFNKPVKLQINYGGTYADDKETGLASFGIYWLNDSTGIWEMVGQKVDAQSNKVEADLEHFSGYATAWEG